MRHLSSLLPIAAAPDRRQCFCGRHDVRRRRRSIPFFASLLLFQPCRILLAASSDSVRSDVIGYKETSMAASMAGVPPTVIHLGSEHENEQVASQPATHPSTWRDKKVVVIIPAYNEERFIGSVVLRARQHANTVLVIDDGSPDATSEIASAAGATVIRQEQNGGKGVALNTGLRKARELSPDVVVLIDGDGQHRPQEMGRVIAPILNGEADIVVGSRYLDHNSKVPRHRVLGHLLFTLLTNRTSGVALTDSQSGFRALSPRALEALSFQSNGFSVESEMQFIARERHLRVVEAPITIQYPDKPKRPVVSHGLLVLNGMLRFIGQYRPLLFFGVFGLVTLLIGLFWSFLVVEIYRTSQQLAVGYALLSVLFTVVGMLGLVCGIILHSVRGLLLSFVETEDTPIGRER